MEKCVETFIVAGGCGSMWIMLDGIISEWNQGNHLPNMLADLIIICILPACNFSTAELMPICAETL